MIYRILIALLVCCWMAPIHAATPAKGEKFKIYMILYRGMTDAEKGFLFHLKNRNIPVDVVTRDCNKDVSKVSEYMAEIRNTKPDLIYAFGTSVAAKLVGLEGKVNPREHITDIPVICRPGRRQTGFQPQVVWPQSDGRHASGSPGRSIQGIQDRHGFQAPRFRLFAQRKKCRSYS